MTDMTMRDKTSNFRCHACNYTGWLYFRCGTPWRCKCNPLPIAKSDPLSTDNFRAAVCKAMGLAP